jgi:hypothetical protein
MASGHVNRANKAEHMAARPNLDVKIFLANSEPSTHGSLLQFEALNAKSAISGRADLSRAERERSFWQPSLAQAVGPFGKLRRPQVREQLLQIGKSELRIVMAHENHCLARRFALPGKCTACRRDAICQ